MIDTIAVKNFIELNPKYMRRWRSTYDVPSDEEIPHEPVHSKLYKQLFMDNGVRVDFTYYPANQQYPKPYLGILVSSLAKVLFNNNIQMINEPWQVEEAIKRMNIFLQETGLIPPLDFGNGILSRLDVCWNHQVGEYVADYLQAIGKLSYPQRERIIYEGGVLFKSRGISTTYYDSYSRNRKLSAVGYLRQEIRFPDPDYIVNRIGIHNPTLRDVSFEWTARELELDLHRLHLNETVICDRDLASKLLIDKYGGKMGTKLYGYVVNRQSMDRDQILAKDIGKGTIRRWERLIREAGVSMALMDKVALPSLHIGSIRVEPVRMLKNEREVLSET